MFSIPNLTSADTLPVHRDSKVKAVFLFNFFNYIDWPKTPKRGASDQLLTVCTHGKQSLSEPLKYIMRSQSKMRARLKEDVLAEELGQCKILFIAQSSTEQVPALLERIQGMPILTVSDISGFSEMGGAVEFYTKDSRIYLRINYGALTESGLEASSKLLGIADVVNK